ncbi:MAG: hypothetical protein U0838_00240 [Chloroflexota bacterium]
MTRDRRLLGAALGFALIVSACSSAASSPAASSAASAAASQGGGATPAATQPAATQPADASAEPTDAAETNEPGISLEPGNAKDLEAMIPDKVGDTTITKTSFDYSTIPWSSLGGANGGSDLEKVIKDNGKTLADVRFAMGVATNAGGGAMMPTMVYALQIKGLDGAKFASGLDDGYDTAKSITVGGKQVKGSIEGGFGTVTYVHDDVVFLALGSEKDLNALVAALP